MESLVRTLENRADLIAGDFVAVRGNVRALASGRRFLVRDLNRAWSPHRLEARDAKPSPSLAEGEDAEVGELSEAVRRVIQERRGELYMLDLHTTSGDGGAFTTVGDSLDNRDFARAIPVPLVLGLEELVEGTLVGHLSELGFTTAVFECGQHGEPAAEARAAAALWIAVRAAGLLAPEHVPEAENGHEMLEKEHRGLPKVLEMRYRHHVVAEDGYRTNPGYRNFHPIGAGDLVGQDRRGGVEAPKAGRILMPLYQEQGEDGFFVVRAFSPAWLWVSRALRKLRVARIVHWLPGVSRDPEVPGALVANRHVARWFALQLFHLLGYRRHLEEGDRLVVVRRRRGA